MQRTIFSIFLFSFSNPHLLEHFCEASEFNLDGDYLIGGLFPVHYTPDPGQTRRPEAVTSCLEKPIYLRGYRGLQVMRFAIEEINNSSTLLPNITLGYHIIDHCTDTHNFPDILHLFSANGSAKVMQIFNHYHSQVISFIGAFSSTETITLAPMFMTDLIPMVSYGASSSTLSDKLVYPSFIRTTPSNKNQIELIIHIIKHFGWNWVAFIGSKSEYSENGFQVFFEMIKNTGICLGYQERLDDKTELNTTFHRIDTLQINVIILFIEELFAEKIITSSEQLNVHNKVWIASDSWSMSNHLLKLQGIKTIGTIIGVTPTVVPLPGFNEFIYQSQHRADFVHSAEDFCNQACDNCSSVSPEDVINENPTYNFPVYSAVYTIAMALHNVLQCNHSGCNYSCTVYPYMLLQEIKHLQFHLNKFFISFDKNLDPPARYSIVFWDTSNHSVKIKQIGTYSNYPVSNLTIFDTHLHWHDSGLVPFSNCSAECKPGHVRQKNGLHQCCFICVECPSNKYANHTADLYSCLKCDQYEWSEAGSTSCQKRSVEYLRFSDGYSIVLMVFASSFMLLCLGVAVLFAMHRSTPVVRSAGGSMCFLMLGCLATSATSAFFYFSELSTFSCITRVLVFVFFYTVCLSCLFVRSFQIICIFKMAAHLPKAHAWWVKYNGQWLVVAALSLLQLLLCTVWVATSPPSPKEDTSFKDQIVLQCNINDIVIAYVPVSLMLILSGLCFCFSYMGTDLPKNYNEAKAITFSMLLFCLSWAIFVTADLMSHTKYVQVVKIVVELSCLYGIMFSYFIPKSFIIVFQPAKNTQEYFQASIQSYTQTISRM
ncbi:taste receptor type 1 member 1-like [Alosa pseudoharengus]|uniref:taste receptor type 1 member 1-like n=1 Tax=Alosa pseudoharengus TaxID=34774 RepID=UPI003F891830